MICMHTGVIRHADYACMNSIQGIMVHQSAHFYDEKDIRFIHVLFLLIDGLAGIRNKAFALPLEPGVTDQELVGRRPVY